MPDTHQVRLQPETVLWLRKYMARQDAKKPQRHRMTYDEAIQDIIRRMTRAERRLKEGPR